MIAKNILDHEEVKCFQYLDIYVSYDNNIQMYQIFIKTNEKIGNIKIEDRKYYYEILNELYKTKNVFDYQKRN